MTNFPRIGAPVPFQRDIYVLGPDGSLGSSVPTATNRVYVVPLDIIYTVTIDRLFYGVGSVASGNGRIGIYNDDGTLLTPAGQALVVQAAQKAQGIALSIDVLSVSDTILKPGRYWVALGLDNVTGTFNRMVDQSNRNWRFTVDPSWGDLPAICPALTATNFIPVIGVRVKTNHPLV